MPRALGMGSAWAVLSAVGFGFGWCYLGLEVGLSDS